MAHAHTNTHRMGDSLLSSRLHQISNLPFGKHFKSWCFNIQHCVSIYHKKTLSFKVVFTLNSVERVWFYYALVSYVASFLRLWWWWFLVKILLVFLTIFLSFYSILLHHSLLLLFSHLLGKEARQCRWLYALMQLFRKICPRYCNAKLLLCCYGLARLRLWLGYLH